jgi:hypothetical protein
MKVIIHTSGGSSYETEFPERRIEDVIARIYAEDFYIVEYPKKDVAIPVDKISAIEEVEE